MKSKNSPPDSSITAAVKAINNLASQELDALFHSGQIDAMLADDEIRLVPIRQKCGVFYRHLVPIRNNLILLLANSYRQYFRVALAHPREVGASPKQWAWNHLRSAIGLTMEWIRDWYVLACDGENQSVRHAGQIPYAPGQTVSIPISLTVPPLPPESWRAPSWLFEVAPTLGFIRPLKAKHAPAIDTEEKLGAAHTRLLLKLARRVFLWALQTAIETVRNEEIAAAGAIPRQAIGGEKLEANKRKPKRKRDRQRMIRDNLIAELDEIAETPGEFLRLMDERNVKPQPTWNEWPGSWVKAYLNPRLRDLIHKDKSRALSRARTGRNR